MRLTPLRYLNQYSDAGGGVATAPVGMDNIVDDEFAKAFLKESAPEVTPAATTPPAVTPPAAPAPQEKPAGPPPLETEAPAGVPAPNAQPAPNNPTPKPAAPAAETQPAAPATTPAGPPPITPAAATTTDPEPLQFSNLGELALRAVGYDQDEIEIAPGVRKAFKDLTEMEQAEVVFNTIEDLQMALQEQSQQPGTGGFIDDSEQRIVEAFRASKGNVKEFVSALQAANPALQAETMTNDQLVMNSLKSQFPTYTDKDLQDELAEMSPAQIERRGNALRQKMLNEGTTDNSAYLAKLPRYAPEPTEAELADVAAITTYAKTLKDIDGIALHPQNVQYLTDVATRIDPNTGLTPFLSRLQTPQELMRATFWAEYGPVLYQNQQAAQQAAIKEAVDQAVRQAKAGIYNQYPETPHFVGTGGASGTPAGEIDYNTINGPQDRLGS